MPKLIISCDRCVENVRG